MAFLNMTHLSHKISGKPTSHKNKQQKSIKIKSNKGYHEEKETEKQMTFLQTVKMKSRKKQMKAIIKNELKNTFK